MSDIKYICFDIGGVANVQMPRKEVISRGKEYFGAAFNEEKLKQMMFPTVSNTDIWREYNNGAIATQRYLEFGLSAGGVPTTERNRKLFRSLLEEACGEAYQPILNLVGQLKANGYHTSVLSNNNEIMYNTPSGEAIKKCVDVAISSHEIMVSKPHWQAFAILLGKIKIKAEERQQVLFIDNKTENTEAAQSCGLQAFHFRSKEVGMDLAFVEPMQYLHVTGIRI